MRCPKKPRTNLSTKDCKHCLHKINIPPKIACTRDSQSSCVMISFVFSNACPVKEEVVAPYWANNTRSEILALLNLYPFEQYVHWEKCT